MPPPGTVVALPVPVSGAARTTPGGVGQHCDAAGVDASAISGCQYQGSLTAGTIFQHTRKPLTMWFRAIWWVTAQKNGASALGLQRILGLGSYLTAWTWLHKLRRAMVRPGCDRLHGTSAASRRGFAVARRRQRLWLLWPAKKTARLSAASVCVRFTMPRPPACRLSSRRRSSPTVWSTRTVGKDMLVWR